jgi:hypothetical protein
MVEDHYKKGHVQVIIHLDIGSSICLSSLAPQKSNRV